MIIDYFEIRDYFASRDYYEPKLRLYNAIFHNIEEFIDPNEINIFYPKNLFIEGSDLEVYILNNSQILRCRIIDEDRIEIKIFFLKDLKDFTCECVKISYEDYYDKLILKFNDNEILILDSSMDTNFSWKTKFEKQIKEIIKVIINKNI